MIAGNPVGSLTILPGMTTLDATFDFPSIGVTDPVTLEYYETNTVYSGAGELLVGRHRPQHD